MAEPKTSTIVVFTCNWYPAIAADNAGVVGRVYTDDCRIVTLLCGGHVTPATILDAFGSGAQGVMVAACKPELCHYINGSSKCQEVVSETKELARLLGIGDERIVLETFDSEDVERFTSSVDAFHAKIAGMDTVTVDRLP